MYLFPYIPDHFQIPLMSIRETPSLHHNSAAQEGHFSALDLRRAGREIRSDAWVEWHGIITPISWDIIPILNGS